MSLFFPSVSLFIAYKCWHIGRAKVSPLYITKKSKSQVSKVLSNYFSKEESAIMSKEG